MDKKRNAAVLQHCDAKKRGTQKAHNHSLTPFNRAVKSLAGGLFVWMILLAIMFAGAWFEGLRPFHEAAIGAGVSLALAAALLGYSGEL